MDFDEQIKQAIEQGVGAMRLSPMNFQKGQVIGIAETGKAFYLVHEDATVDERDGTVTAMVQHYPDGGMAPRHWSPPFMTLDVLGTVPHA